MSRVLGWARLPQQVKHDVHLLLFISYLCHRPQAAVQCVARVIHSRNFHIVWLFSPPVADGWCYVVLHQWDASIACTHTINLTLMWSRSKLSSCAIIFTFIFHSKENDTVSPKLHISFNVNKSISVVIPLIYLGLPISPQGQENI